VVTELAVQLFIDKKTGIDKPNSTNVERLAKVALLCWLLDAERRETAVVG
jgi:hypothetical protein